MRSCSSHVVHHGAQPNQLIQEQGHVGEGNHVGTIAERGVRIWVGLEEQSIRARRHGATREHRRKFALATGLVAATARELHRMRCVEEHGPPGPAQQRNRPHVGDEVVVAEGRTPFGQEELAAAGLRGLPGHLFHLSGGKELSLFKVHNPAGADGGSNQIVLIGNDGGVFRTANARGNLATGPRATCNGATAGITIAWSNLNRGYGVTQFYHGTPFPDGTRYLAGAQDNGTILGTDDSGPDGWRLVYGGDGGFSAVNPSNINMWLMEYQWANLGRTTNGGNAVTVSTTGLDPAVADNLGPEGNYLFVTPFTLDARANRIWLGGNFLFRGNDFGSSWAKTGQAMPESGRVSAIAVSPGNNAVILSGTDQGDIMRTQVGSDGSAVQLSTRPRAGWVTSIAFDPRNDNAIYATYGNFGGAHVYRTLDGGATWQSIDGSGATGVPDIPVHSIVTDPDDPLRLYLGTDLGVMVSIDGGRGWMREETGFGPAVTMWLSIVKTPGGAKYLFAFTHGRGAWRVRLP